MKKFYFIAIAATTLAACTSNETLKEAFFEDNETELIGFETYHEKSTKAAVYAQADLIDDNGGFGVYGFKHLNSRTATDGAINLSDTNPASNENYVTSIFDNVKVWYEAANTYTRYFTYAVPKYWDKEKYYTFFAYAPYASKAAGEVKGIAFNQATGKFTRNDIKALQSTNNYISNAGANGDRIQYGDSVETAAIDYLIAPYVPGQKSGNTNQIGKSYDGKGLTVGFTFSHILSKLNVYLRAKDETNDPTNDTKNGHEYSGVQDIKVSKLNIQNLPNATTEIATYAQNATNEVAGTWTPANYTTALNIIGGGNATAAGPLYILDGGTGTATSVTTKPTNYIPQEFHYFVAPNTPVEDTSTDAIEGKYILNIDYTITYVDGTVEPYTRTIDLSGKSAEFTSMAQNNIYKIIITIGLEQIYLTVETVNAWDPNNDSKTTIVEVQ
ncbi:MAG: fimbrillin family protein [Bacteroidaceae bacterium]|nr:fimbrillin family protein [Bacteroidaceae bacterium]